MQDQYFACNIRTKFATLDIPEKFIVSIFAYAQKFHWLLLFMSYVIYLYIYIYMIMNLGWLTCQHGGRCICINA